MRHRHTKRDVTGKKWASTQTQSPAFLSTYVEWRNSRLEALPANRKVDRWHEAMVNDNIWHRWFLAGIVESEIMISRSALAHIYMIMSKTAGTSPSVGSAKRGPLGLHRARSARIQIRHSISCELIRFPLGSWGKRDSTGRKIIYSYSSEFLSKYVEWRKSRFEALPSTRKCDSGWYQALSNDNIWHCWFLAGIVD